MGNQQLIAASYKQYRKLGLEAGGEGLLITSEILLEDATQSLLSKFTEYFLYYLRVTHSEY
jgi:hypothetical protein